MKKLGFRIRVAGGWAVAGGLFAAVSCGGGDPGKGSGIMSAAGGGGGAGGASTPCLALLCSQDQFTLATQIMDQCIVHCGTSSSGNGSTQQGEFEDGEFFIETSSDTADAGASLDGGSSTVEYALIRIPDENPLGGHWLCAASGTLDEATSAGTAQSYTLTQLSDLGPCEGDAASTDSLTITANSGATPTVTGTVNGQQVTNTSSQPVCGLDRCEFPLPDQGAQTVGFIAVRTETDITLGEATPVSEAAWVAPRHLGFHLICAGAGSMLTRSEAITQVSLVGLTKKTCPGTPVTGTIQGKLSSEPATAGGF